MKAFTQIIAVLIVVNLATANSVPVQDAHQAEVVLAQKQAEWAQKTAETSQRAADVATADARAYSLAFDQAERGSTEQALLVLTSQIKAEDLANLTLDLNIMSRILDNKLGRAQPALYSRYKRSLTGFDTGLRPWSVRAGATQTQAMYVQGYAVLFFIDVDFPLSPPQAQAEKVKEGADQVWEQTKWEMTASNKDLPLEYTYQRDAAARQYDKDTVEQLKATLIKALKHAANIRNLKADESVILVVAGTEATPPILTIRAKKVDIDAHSADKIDYDQFRQRTQILTSRASLGPGQPETRSWPSQNLLR
jgi:hypothetical protein